MKRLLLIGIAVVGTLLVVSVLLGLFNVGPRAFRFLILSEDEPPIIVKNGTMDIAPGVEWHWKGEDPDSGHYKAYSYQPNGIDFEFSDPGLWINVFAASNACTGASMPFHAPEVSISFSDNYVATFKRHRGIVNYRVNVTPGDKLTPPDAAGILRYGTSAGYITHLMAPGPGGPLECTFTSKEQLTRIEICKTEKRCS